MSSTGERDHGGGGPKAGAVPGRPASASDDRDAALADTLPARSGPSAAVDKTLPPSVVLSPSLNDGRVDARGPTLRPEGDVDPRAETLKAPSKVAELAETLSPDAAAVAATLGPDAAPDPRGATRGGDVVSVGDLSKLQSDYPVARWDRYEFQKKLGQGGMGAVYKARDRRLDRDVALKFIRGGDPNMVMRFLQEARAQARIDHPHVCKVYEVGEVEGKAYIAMQFVDGQSLHRAAKGLSLTEKVLLMRQVSEAMHEAHRLGIIHRDLKPDNIMVERLTDGTLSPVVMDFGLARESGDNRGLTESGAVMGTPAYMAPEQARGDVRTLDRRADVYSLGATLYDLIAGVPPFDAESVVDVLLQVMNEDAVPLRNRLPSVPADLETIVMKCLRKEPGARYDSAKALADDLQRYIDGEPIQGRRESVIGRVRRRAKKNLALVFVSVVSFVLVVSFGVQWVRVQLAAKRDRERAAELVKLERQLGQDIKEMEWFLRSAYQLPLHDITPQLAMVRQRMAAMDSQRAALRGDDGGRIDYAIGRGHLALHEPAEALRHLKQAKARGLDIPELHYALGRALGERFQQALEEARRQGDKSWVEKRRKELEAEYLQPAVQELEKSRGGTLDSPEYLEGLIAFYRKQHDIAIEKAKTSFAKYPWLYESKILEGDVKLSIGAELCDEGKFDVGIKNIDESIALYAEAAAVGRSDVETYESTAESYVRKSSALLLQGKGFDAELRKIIEFSDSAIVINRFRLHGFNRKAYSHFWLGFMKGASAQDPRDEFMEVMKNCRLAIHLDSRNALANDLLGNGNNFFGVYENENGRDPLPYWERAESAFQIAIQSEPRFPWALSDYGLLLQGKGKYLAQRGSDWRPALLRAVENFRRAIEVDPSYASAYVNQLDSYFTIIELMSIVDENPELVVKDAQSVYMRARSMNGNIVLIYYNMANIMIKYANYLLMSNLNVGSHFGEIQKTIDSILSIDRESLFVDVLRLRFGILKMMMPGQTWLVMNAMLSELREYANLCRLKQGNAGQCDYLMAMACMAIFDRLGDGGPWAEKLADDALAFAKRGFESNPRDPDGAQVYARSIIVRLKLAKGKRVDVVSLLKLVWKIAKFALDACAYDGRNHGNIAELYLLQAGYNFGFRHDNLKMAQEHFRKAVKINPRLEKIYAKQVQEVDALLAGQGGGK